MYPFHVPTPLSHYSIPITHTHHSLHPRHSPSLTQPTFTRLRFPQTTPHTSPIIQAAPTDCIPATPHVGLAQYPMLSPAYYHSPSLPPSNYNSDAGPMLSPAYYNSPPIPPPNYNSDAGPMLSPAYYNSPSIPPPNYNSDTSLVGGGDNPSLSGQLAAGGSGLRSNLNTVTYSTSSRRNLSGSFDGETPGTFSQLHGANDGQSPTVINPTQQQELRNKRRLSGSDVSVVPNSVPSGASSSRERESLQGPKVKAPRWDQFINTQPAGNSFQYSHVPTSPCQPHSSNHMTSCLMSTPRSSGYSPLIEGLGNQEPTDGSASDNTPLPVVNSDCHGDGSNRVSVSLRFPLQRSNWPRTQLADSSQPQHTFPTDQGTSTATPSQTTDQLTPFSTSASVAGTGCAVSNVQSYTPMNSVAQTPDDDTHTLLPSVSTHSSQSSLSPDSDSGLLQTACGGRSLLQRECEGGKERGGSEGEVETTQSPSNDSLSESRGSSSHDLHMSHVTSHQTVVPQRESDRVSDGEFQVMPNSSGGRGFSLSVEISGSRRGSTIDFNLDVSGIEESSRASGRRSSTITIPPVSPTPHTPLIISPTPPASPYIHISPGSLPGTSGLGSEDREEVIIVDSSDDEDDHTVIMFTSHRQHQTPRHHHPPTSHYGNGTHGRHMHRAATQISQDELLARRLQAQFDRELDISVHDPSHHIFPPHITPIVPHHPLHSPPFPPSPTGGRGSVSSESNLWSSRGPSGAVVPPLVPSLDGPSNSPDPTSNYHALASHIHHITPTDAHRILRAASLSGRPTVGHFSTRRRSRFHGNTSTFFNSILARHSSYEELLELAERLGPAHSRGLTKEEINRLPSRAHRKSDGDDKRCVVCMSEFQSRERIRSLRPCAHDFHQKCIDKWLKEHNTCPICRVTVSVSTQPTTS